jgi:hypothetical protein
MKRALIAAAMVALLAGPAAADEIDAAYALCQVFQNTGLAPECEVSGWSGTVDVRLDTNSTEARKICVGTVDMIAQQTDAFAKAPRTWQLRILSPYSGDHPLAACDLR